MESKTDTLNNGGPLPQRNKGGNLKTLKGHQPQDQNQEHQEPPEINEGAPVEKKPRFGNNQQDSGNFHGKFNQGGGNFGGGGSGNRRSRDRRRSQRNEQHNKNNQSRDDGNRVGGNMEMQNNRNDRRSGGGGRGAGGYGGGGYGGSRNDDFFVVQRLRNISGPTHELPQIECQETKFSGRNRLYVGNLTNDVTEEELRELFKPFGEIGEVFSNPEKNFAFLKLDFHNNAEKAKRELDGTTRKGRTLRIRFAPNATILRIKNLTPLVSNELLYKAFEIFGPVERAIVVVDDRGKHTGEGIVEFAKKSSANAALRLCNDKCFFLTASLRPCVVEPFELNDDADGLPEKTLNKKSQEFNHERNVGPRFAELDSFEHEYGTRWKQLYELYKTKQEALKRELKMEEDKLEAQMEYARYEHETEMLRQELRKREQDNERKKMEWEMREKQAEEMKLREEENLRRQQSDMQNRMLRQEEEMRRRQQENTLFMQAQQLNSMLDQQEGKQGPSTGVGGIGGGNSQNFDNFDHGNNQTNSPFDFRDALSAFANNNGGNAVLPSGNTNNQQINNQLEFRVLKHIDFLVEKNPVPVKQWFNKRSGLCSIADAVCSRSTVVPEGKKSLHNGLNCKVKLREISETL